MTTPQSPAGRSVLVAEDEPTTRNLLNLFLSERGFQVFGAGTATEALEICRRDQPAIILIDADFSTPRGGLRLLADLRATRPGVRLCLMSGGGTFAVEELELLGAAAFLAKPFTIDLLLQVLEALGGGPG